MYNNEQNNYTKFYSNVNTNSPILSKSYARLREEALYKYNKYSESRKDVIYRKCKKKQ